MKLDEKSVIPIPHEDNDAVQERQRRRNPSETSHNDHLQYLPSLARSFQNDELSTPLSQSPYSRSKSTSNRKKPNSHYVEMNLSDRSSRYTPNLSHSAPELRSQHDGPYPNRKSPVSLDGMPLNEKEKKWWDELRETAGNLADFASFVHRTGKVPPRNDLEWARSNFHIFSESMSALQMVTGVLHGEGPRFPDAGLSKLNMSNSNTYGKRLLSQSPILENRNNHPLSTAFHPPQLNRKISYDQNIFPGRGFRSSSSLAESRSYNGVASMMPDQRSLSRQEYGPERMDVEQTRWRDDLVDTNDRTRDRIRHEIPQEHKSYYPDSLEPNRNIIGERSYPFRPQTSPHNSFSHYSNDASRSTYYNSNDQQRPIIEADHHIHQMPLIGRNSIQNSAGLPIPQSPSHDPRSFHIKRRASSDYGGHPHSTNYSPPFRGSSRDQHFPQHHSHFPSGYYRDEYMDSNQIDHSYMSGDDGGSSVGGGGGGGGGGGDIGLGFRPSKYRKRSRAPAPGSCVSCGVRDTPEWRRGPNGARTLCNACGLHFSKLLRKKKQEQSDDSASVSIEELRSSLKLPGSGSVGQTSPPF